MNEETCPYKKFVEENGYQKEFDAWQAKNKTTEESTIPAEGEISAEDMPMGKPKLEIQIGK